MSESQTLLLGFIAGVTILIGLPLGRVRALRPGTRQFLNALAVGILLFLLWDVLAHAFEPVDNALGKLHDGTGGIFLVTGLGVYPNLGVIDAYATVRRGDEQYAVRFSDALHSARFKKQRGAAAAVSVERTEAV